jgi:hypothetical protein
MTIEEINQLEIGTELLYREVARMPPSKVTLAGTNRDGHGRIWVRLGGMRLRAKPRQLELAERAGEAESTPK